MMNLLWGKLRNRFSVETVEANLFIKINGPPPNAFKPNKFVFTWLSKHRGPTDQKRLNQKTEKVVEKEKTDTAVDIFC